MAYTIESWLKEAYGYYKALGFFAHYQGENGAVIRALHKALMETSSEPITTDDLDTPEFDLFFLSLDPLRSLYSVMDFGDFLAPGNEAYVASLEALANISRGVFKPKNIEEVWDTPDGPIRLRFDFEGMPRELKMETWGGAFDFRILLQLNSLLAGTEYRFEMAPLDDILFVTVLKAEEKASLERDRELSFMVLSLTRTFHPLHRLGRPLEFPQNPDEPVFYIGTLNEHLDRCVGRLRFILRGENLEGHHQYLGESHREDFTFEGKLDKSTSRASGKLSGNIAVGNDLIPYEGTWNGEWCTGNRVATGEWQGWFVRDRPTDKEVPEDTTRIYRGQWGLLEEDFSRSKHHYLQRIRGWLEAVWQSRSSEDYPWLMTPED
ncbi:MAG: hypothetical protein WC314_09220 [Vulcanimicrobiota bacterium]